MKIALGRGVQYFVFREGNETVRVQGECAVNDLPERVEGRNGAMAIVFVEGGVMVDGELRRVSYRTCVRGAKVKLRSG